VFARLNAASRRAMLAAFREAQRCQHDFVGTEHLLYGLLREADGPVAHLLRSAGGDTALLLAKVELSLRRHGETDELDQFPLSPALKRALVQAEIDAAAFRHELVGPYHLLLGLLHGADSEAAQLLFEIGVHRALVRAALAHLPPDQQPEYQVQAAGRPAVASSKDVSADELDSWLRPGIKLPADRHELPFRQSDMQILESQLRLVQFALAAVVGFTSGYWAAGWEIGVALGTLAAIISLFRSSVLGSLFGALVGLMIVLMSRLQTRDTYWMVVPPLAGLLLGTLLGDFWRFDHKEQEASDPPTPEP
jgi:hypothetical protein